MSVLEVKNAFVRYITGDFKDIGLKEYIMRHFTHNYSVTEFFADRDISFSLEKGDMLGIIGSNGAGKSTLLKAVSGIMEPTYGSVRREGSIAALLELGSGFDGDLSVRENTYLRGALLGYTKKFMDETYDSIIEFAELQDFQDRPFKQLSSGMQSRLAFSIASLVNPDILILDEVLSVGDGAFKKKSEDKMKEIIGSGATTILVTHSIDQVREMCNKVLWLHKGEQIAFGEDVQGICDRYEDFLAGKAEPVKQDMQIMEKGPEEQHMPVLVPEDVKEMSDRKWRRIKDSNESLSQTIGFAGTAARGKFASLNFLEIIIAVLFACSLVYYLYLNFAKLNPYGLDSDLVNEISYRQASWEQKTLFPEGFVSGHESLSTRPILLYWLFYGITHNFLFAYQLENMFTFLLELAMLYFLMRKLKIKRAVRFLSLFLFVTFLPDPLRAFNFWPGNGNVLFSIGIIATLYLRIVIEDELQNSETFQTRKIHLACFGICALSIIYGYGTIKMLLWLYLPLLALDVIKLLLRYFKCTPAEKTEKCMFCISSAAFILCISVYYVFSHVHADAFVAKEFSIVDMSTWFSWDVLTTPLQIVLEYFGLRSSAGSVGSVQTIMLLMSGCVAAVLFFAVVWLTKREERSKDFVLYWLIATFLVSTYFIVTGISDKNESRYFNVTALLLPILFAFAMNDWIELGAKNNALWPMVVVSFFVLGLFFVNMQADSIEYSEPVSLAKAAEYIQDNGYKYVVGSYWNSGILKGYTNGTVESLHSDPVDGIATLTPYNWVIDVNKFTQEHEGEPWVLLLTDEEEAKINAQGSGVSRLLQRKAVKVYEVDQYNLYALTENPYTLIKKAKSSPAGLPAEGELQKTDMPDNDGFIYANAKLNESNELVSDGSADGYILWGPYFQSVAGIYDITLHYAVDSIGEVTEGKFDVALDTVQLVAVPFSAECTSVTLEDVVIEEGHQFEIRVWVPHDMIVRVQSVEYKRVG